MARSGQLPHARVPKGCVLAPIHRVDESTPLLICILLQASGDFTLLRDLPGARVYLGAICDAQGEVQSWVEIHVQAVDVKQLDFAGRQEQLSNPFFDARWQKEGTVLRGQMPDSVIATKMEVENPGPILIKRLPAGSNLPFAPIEATPWRVCKDDALLQKHALPAYTTTPFRYLVQPGSETFIATTNDAPTGPAVKGIDQLKTGADVQAVFNPAGGLVRIVHYSPMELESYLQILEGRAWNEKNSETGLFPPDSAYTALQAWSSNPEGLPFLLHAKASATEHLNEIFLLKLSLLHDLIKKVRTFVRGHQLPLLNLSPASFRVDIKSTSDLFPGLWSAESQLVKPGQAYPLQIKHTHQRYFLRLGKVDPTPFFPQVLGAHSFGIGSVQIRDVNVSPDGVVLEGTLVAEDFLAIDPHDLLWFKLPLENERLEFYSHVAKPESGGGPREARFRTVPAMLSEAVVAKLKASAGVHFAKSPYEVWPLLSSPCDLFSLGVIAIRIMLANSQKNLPVLLDEVLSLARRINDASGEQAERIAELKKLIQAEPKIYELISPGSLVETGYTSKQAWSAIHADVWFETVSLLLRFFPETGAHAFCKSFGDVHAMALETVFDPSLQAFEFGCSPCASARYSPRSSPGTKKFRQSSSNN